MQDIKNKLEAVLFTTGIFLTTEELSKLSGIGSIGLLKESLESLKQDYDSRQTSLVLINEGDKWKLGLKKDYLYLTEKLLTDSELDKPTQETLAIIAYKQPVLQSDVIKIRGNSAYEHIKTLKEHEFVTADKSGRTRILKLAPKFFDYFNVINDKLKEKLFPQNEEIKE